MEYYYDFKFGRNQLSDFGGTIYNSDGFKRTVGTDPEHITLPIPTKGEIYYGTKQSPFTFDLDCYFEKSLEGREIANWICNQGEQRFQYIDDDKYCNAVYNGKLEFSIYGGEIEDQSIVTIPFICYDGTILKVGNDSMLLFPVILYFWLIIGFSITIGVSSILQKPS